MGVNVTAKAQTADALEQAARTCKRQIRELRELLGTIRRAQATALGIEVEDIPTRPEGGRSDRIENTREG